VKPTRAQLVEAMAKAMAKMEGFFLDKPAPTVAQRNRNPGNLRTWPGCAVVDGYASFKTLEDGWAALRKQITNNIWGMGAKDTYPLRTSEPMNFLQFFAGQRQPDGVVRRGGYPGYAPAADKNHPAGYAKFVYVEVSMVLKLPAEITVETPIREICEV